MSTSTSQPNSLGPDENDGGAMPSHGGQNPGEALSSFDFSHGSHVESGPQIDLESQGSDHSDVHAALASMSSEDALDYAINHIGGADHLDAEHADAGHGDGAHVDTPLDTSHDA
jgi:hypothetical protein